MAADAPGHSASDERMRAPRRANALSPAHKQLRRGELLTAARTLFHHHGELPTVADIARNTGLAKGTVYLYFRTKEELFVALLEDDFAHLMRALGNIIEGLPASREAAPAAFAHAFATALDTLPDLLPLAALAHGVLEKNLPVAAMQRFKGGLAAGLSASGHALSERFPGRSHAAGNSLLLHSWALTLGLSQSLRIPDALAPALQGPPFAVLRTDARAELGSALAALWRGSLGVTAVAAPPPAPTGSPADWSPRG